MNYSTKLEKFNDHLKKYFKKDINLDETRLIMLFFIQKIQFINLIIDIINPQINNKNDIALKSAILYCLNYQILLNETLKFKKEFGKKELINDILEYIKKSNIFKNNFEIVDTEIESDNEENFFKLSFIEKRNFFTNCINIKDVLEKYKNDDKIHDKLYHNREKINKSNDKLLSSFSLIEKEWEKCSDEQKNVYNIIS